MRKKGRKEIEREWCERVLNAPTEIIEQNDGSYRIWGFIQEEGKYLRVIVLSDRETVENAFFGRNYKTNRKKSTPTAPKVIRSSSAFVAANATSPKRSRRASSSTSTNPGG